MDWFSHTLSGLIGAFAAFLPTYVWFRKQMLAVASASFDLKSREATALQAHDTVVSEAWKALFDECHTERLKQNERIDRFSDQLAALHRENADQATQIKVLEAKVAQLERGSPATVGCPPASPGVALNR